MSREELKTIVMLMGVLEADHNTVELGEVYNNHVLFAVDNELFLLERRHLILNDPYNTVEDILPLLEVV